MGRSYSATGAFRRTCVAGFRPCAAALAAAATTIELYDATKLEKL